MARAIPVLKCLMIIGALYCFTITLIFMSYDANQQQPCTPVASRELDNSKTKVEFPKGFDIRNVNEPKNQSLNMDIVRNKRPKSPDSAIHKNNLLIDQGDNPNWGKHKMAVIVPFRDRLEELLEFAPHLHNYLVKKHIRHKIYVINQVDSLRFNRGGLINVGVREMDSDCDYIAMHDVDLLPLNEDLDYSYPSAGPFHLASPDYHPLYHYKSFIGGILLITKKHFELVNGMSNRYWGWGREDDELYVRFKKAGLITASWNSGKNGAQELVYEMRRPKNLTTGYNTFKHIHDKKQRPRDNKRFFDQKKKTSKLDRETGLSTIRYTVLQRHNLTLNDAPVTMLEVKLSCDYGKTPWCLRQEDHHLLLKTPAPPDMKAEPPLKSKG